MKDREVVGGHLSDSHMWGNSGEVNVSSRTSQLNNYVKVFLEISYKFWKLSCETLSSRYFYLKKRCRNTNNLLIIYLMLANLVSSDATRAIQKDREKGIVRLAIIAPDIPDHEQPLRLIMPSIDLAVKSVTDNMTGTLPGWRFELYQRNSNCSSTVGGLASFELNEIADAFLGPTCDYVVNQVAGYAGIWGTPVLTTAAQMDYFDKKMDFATLTRMAGSYSLISEMVHNVLKLFGWSIAGLVFYDTDRRKLQGHSKCYFTLKKVFAALNKKDNFHESISDDADYDDFKEILIKLSEKARSE
ncbi:hypothetical protein LSTR_LSTR008981 [Laodelphax striatellus]|uniref:Receptor ligand binding region domain-containing protein n=1 Tax=Laodelphax striatellus TaxID=195883 RepID=A0A482WXM9_LAOST|nr:hypothetical protein LSTR_LSTR008981 [Laodelphax striatellus]